MKQYRGIGYSVQRIGKDLHLLLDLGGPSKNKMFPLKAHNEKEIRKIIDEYLASI